MWMREYSVPVGVIYSSSFIHIRTVFRTESRDSVKHSCVSLIHAEKNNKGQFLILELGRI